MRLLRRIRYIHCVCWAVVIYSPWLYIVLEHSRSPSPHKMISHHIVFIKKIISFFSLQIFFFKNVPGVLRRTQFFLFFVGGGGILGCLGHGSMIYIDVGIAIA